MPLFVLAFCHRSSSLCMHSFFAALYVLSLRGLLPPAEDIYSTLPSRFKASEMIRSRCLHPSVVHFATNYRVSVKLLSCCHRPSRDAPQLFDARRRVLHELAASTTSDRAFWVETLTKASRYTTGSGDGRRQAALSKGLLVTTRAASSRAISGAGLGGARAEAGLGTGGAGRREGGRRLVSSAKYCLSGRKCSICRATPCR